MNEAPQRVCLVNGSLRGQKASSLAFLHDVSRRLPGDRCHKTFITVRGNAKEGYSLETLASMGGADALVFVFPLYDYGLPGALMRLLEEYYAYVKAGHPHQSQAKVYVVVNCGYPRPELTTGEAVRAMRNFCRRLSLNWGFAVCIGTGPVVAMTKRVPFFDLKLKQAFSSIGEDIARASSEPTGDCFIRPIIPEPIIRRIKEYYEKRGEMIAQRRSDQSDY